MKILKRLLIPLVILIGLIVIGTRATDLSTLPKLLSEGQPIALGLAFLFACILIIFQAELIHSLYRYFGVHEPLRQIIPVLLASNFANFILPSIGFSGVTLFVANAKAKKINTITALTVAILYYFFYYLSFTTLLLLGLLFLIVRSDITAYQSISALIFLIIIFFGGNLLWHLSHSNKRSLKLMTVLIGFANTPYRWLKKRDLISDQHIEHVADGMYEHLNIFRKKPSHIVYPFLYGLLTHISGMLILGFLFIAFRHPVSLEALIIGFSLSILFSLISITPSGLGFVEGAMVLSFKSLGIPADIALVVTLVYRGFIFWIPFIVGLILIKQLHITKKIEQ
jgi:uncharacterized protein (TIRG00374 family)